MKNKFIGYGLISILGTNATQVLADSSSLEKKRSFGIPDSITEYKNVANNRLKLSMSKTNIPHQTWQDIESLAKVWSILSTKRFSPSEYIQLIKSQSLSKFNSDKIFKSKEFKVLAALASPEILNIASSADYETLISHLISQGVMEENSESLLTTKIEKLLQNNHNFKQQLQSVMLKNETNNNITINETDLGTFLEILKTNQAQPMSCTVAAVCIAFVAVGAAIYVAAAVNVAAGLNVAVQIAIAVNVAITVGGGGGGGGGGSCATCHNTAHNSPGKIEKTMVYNLDLIEQFALITEQPILHTKAVTDFKRKEARAVLQAVINIGLVEVPESKKEELFDTLDKLVHKSLEIY